MEITLQTVRDTLRGSFGRDSFVASFITSVHADTSCLTAGINAEGTTKYNPEFVAQHITAPAELFCLVVHELMHPMFGHFVYQNAQLENIAADMVINVSVSLLFAKHSGQGALFRRTYSPIGLEGLLRPGSNMHQSRYAKLYGSFYEGLSSDQKLSTGEVIQALKILTPSDDIPKILLLGGHGGETGKSASCDSVAPFSSDLLSRIAADMKRIMEKPTGYGVGFGESLYDFFLDVLKTYLTLKRVLLDQFTTRQKMDRFRTAITRPRIGVSPIPIRPSKRDFVLLAADVPPFHYHNPAHREAHEDRGLAVYLDVSGSVNQHLPEIIGLLHSLKTDLKTILLFSNKVVEVPFKTLLQGRIHTTIGTDFDCIAEHIVEQGYDKAVIMTDGYASMKEENQEPLKGHGVRMLTVLFGGRTECPEFAQFGDVVTLEDVVQ